PLCRERQRYGTWNSGRRMRAGFREIPPSRQLEHACQGWHRAGSCHCERDCRDAWRAHLGRVNDGSGLDVPHRVARARPNRRGCSMSKRILVVEDQEDLRAILRDFLSASGCTAIEAVDSAESVAKEGLEHPDLVLMDIQLPVLDTRRARSRLCPRLADPYRSLRPHSRAALRLHRPQLAFLNASPLGLKKFFPLGNVVCPYRTGGAG